MLICNLIFYRLKSGLTQEQLGKKLGISKNTISNIEIGKFLPSVFLTYKIMCFFNISFYDLFTFKEVM